MDNAAGNPAQADDFTGRVALVTGAARGQGRVHALAFAERGADVVICDRCADSPVLAYPLGTEAELDETAKLVAERGRRCVSVVADTADRDAMVALVQRAESELGRVDIAVANAGVTATGQVQNTPSAVWNEVIGANLTGVFNTIAAVSPGMIDRGYGRIVTVSSMMGRQGGPNIVAYGASKWGVIGLTKSAAQDLAAHGITVNAVAPGNISTPMIHNDALYRVMRPDLDSPTWDDVAGVFTMLHVQPVSALEPEEVSRVVLFLTAEASAHLTGLVVPVDAGVAARVTA